MSNSYLDTHRFRYILNPHLLTVLERMQHRRLRKTYLPLVSQTHVPPLELPTTTLLQVEFIRLTFVDVVTTLRILNWRLLDHTEALRQKISLLPLTHKLLDLRVHIFWFGRSLIWSILFTVIDCRWSFGKLIRTGIKSAFIGYLKLTRSVILQERTGIVFTITPLTHLPRLECYILLHTLQNSFNLLRLLTVKR